MMGSWVYSSIYRVGTLATYSGCGSALAPHTSRFALIPAALALAFASLAMIYVRVRLRVRQPFLISTSNSGT